MLYELPTNFEFVLLLFPGSGAPVPILSKSCYSTNISWGARLSPGSCPSFYWFYPLARKPKRSGRGRGAGFAPQTSAFSPLAGACQMR